MSVAKIIELSARSTTSFEDAIQQAVSRASATLKNIVSAWVKEQHVEIENGQVVAYRVNMSITFILNDEVDSD